MEKFVKRTLLYDFYGELLTGRQRQIYESVVQEDLSLGEAAQEFGISRQAVHDIVKRCDRALAQYESKLHLVEKFLGIREQVRRIQELAREGRTGEIETISSEILEEL